MYIVISVLLLLLLILFIRYSYFSLSNFMGGGFSFREHLLRDKYLLLLLSLGLVSIPFLKF